jgi:hypothetical protein
MSMVWKGSLMDAQEDLAFMKNVDRWPYWPLLPLAQKEVGTA